MRAVIKTVMVQAAGVVIDVGGDEARAQDGKDEHEPQRQMVKSTAHDCHPHPNWKNFAWAPLQAVHEYYVCRVINIKRGPKAKALEIFSS